MSCAAVLLVRLPPPRYPRFTRESGGAINLSRHLTHPRSHYTRVLEGRSRLSEQRTSLGLLVHLQCYRFLF